MLKKTYAGNAIPDIWRTRTSSPAEEAPAGAGGREPRVPKKPEMVKLIRAQGGCLGTKSRRKT